MQNSFYWHDYETFGVDPKRDRAVQFAGIRTDAELNIISEPLVIYSRPSNDFLPSPEACLITGITPQLALEKGLSEAEFIKQIHAELSRASTCGVGYNSLRFDDEVTRFTLYRNFYDPYAREWQNGCSRWDIIDMVRLCYALRPEGINWPLRDDGTVSFRLEELSRANGIVHEAAHDALSDVYATIGLAKLIRQKQPKLYDYVLEKRNKQCVARLLDLQQKPMLLHTSRMFPAAYGCSTLVMPLAKHPTNNNGVIVFDLRQDPAALLSLSVEQIQQRLFTRQDQLPEGVERIALKTVHLNKCPVLSPSSVVRDPALQQRLQLDLAACEAHRQRLLHAEGLAQKIQQVHTAPEYEARQGDDDPELTLYGGGFLSRQDRALSDQLREVEPEALADFADRFQDERLPELLFRYRARNFPQTLNAEEQTAWQQLRRQRLGDVSDYVSELEGLLQRAIDERSKRILIALLEYVQTL
ncbi:MAG: exodeoxyribonuclease I [Gammaproteobacteria bacterium]|nr:exodeoxyribonuclease I [Gammaproteobacteria bacterium]